MKGLRRPKADKGVLEGIPPRIMSQKANGGGRSVGRRPGAAGYIRRRAISVEIRRIVNDNQPPLQTLDLLISIAYFCK